MNGIGLNMAAVMASDSLYVGGNWGFLLKENEEYEQILGYLSQEPNIRMTEVSNGIIVFVAPNYLQSVVSQVEQLTPDILNKVNTRVNEEVPVLQKLLNDIYKGKTRYGFRKNGYEEYAIGIYSCNNTHKIRLNGIEYPAFSLSALDVLKQINILTKYVQVLINTGDGFEDLKDIIAYNKMDAVNNGLEISTTMTGVFLTIRIVR